MYLRRTYLFAMGILLITGVVRCGGQEVSASGDAAQFLTDSWGVNEGLPQSSVFGIVQSHDGYLWLGTLGGLARFDGIRFATFDSAKTPELLSEGILQISESGDGTIWIATLNSGLVEFRRGVFKNYTTKEGLPSNRVHAITTDREGTVWAATEGGLARLDQAGVKAALVSDRLTSAVAEGLDGRLWVGTDDGVLEFNGGELVSRRATPDRVVSIHEAANGILWIGTTKGLVWLEVSPKDEVWKATPIKGYIHAIFEDSHHAIWVGTGTQGAPLLKGGLWRWSGGNWIHYGEESGLPEDSMLSITQDGEGNLWVGTYSHALYRLKPKRLRVIANGPDLPGNVASAVREDHDGALWIGLACGGIVKYERGHYRAYALGDGLANCVKSLAEDDEGGIWAGTSGGLARLKNERLQQILTPSNSGLPAASVTALLEDRQGALWAGTTGGLSRFKDGRITVYRKSQGLVDDDIRCLYEDRDSAIWIGTAGGMSRFQDGMFENYTAANGLPHPSVRAIYRDDDGTVWIGTYGGGLTRLRDGHFAYFDMKNGLPENVVSGIQEDKEGDLWLSGNRGIHRVSRKALNNFAEGKAPSFSVVTYGTSDGMASAECNGATSPAGWEDGDGTLWFPTMKGVVGITPADMAINNHPPQVAIEDVLLNRNHFDAAQSIHLPPGRADLEIHYTGLSPTTPENIHFQYKLSGLDQTWVDAGSRRVAYYPNLPAGSYRFSVVAANRDGVWNRQAAALDITVAPFLWMTWWFRLLCVAAAACLACAIYYRRVRQLTAHLDMQYVERLSERERVARELHDTLLQGLQGLISHLQAVAKKIPDHELARQMIERTLKRAQEIMLDGRERAQDLRSTPGTVGSLSEAFSMIREEFTRAHPAALRVIVEGTPRDLHPIVRDETYWIGREALMNAFFGSEGRDIEVGINYDERELRLRFRDDGCGIEPQIFDTDGQAAPWRSRGMHERAKKIGGDLKIYSIPGTGTEIDLRIPASIAYRDNPNGSWLHWLRRLRNGHRQ